MILIFKIFVLVALIQILNRTDRPFLCAGIYATILLPINLMLETPLHIALISAGIAFALASLYFWLLNYFKYGWQYWLTFVGGILVGLV